jgi:uncharacterized protein YndB with AHSA1/START domain
MCNYVVAGPNRARAKEDAMTVTQDSIERQITIDAPAERVWALVSQPGWWINNGVIVDHEIERVGDDLDVIHDPDHGEFPIRTERLDPPRYAAFRWLADREDRTGSGPSTLTEFWIEDRAGAEGVTLRVLESGFSTLGASDEERRKHLDENTEGWEQELAAARTYVEAAVEVG